MKKRTTIFILTLAMMMAAGAFAACDEPDSSSPAVPSESVSVGESDSASESDSQPEEKSYTVTFVTNGGSEVAAVKVEEGGSVDLSSVVTTKEGSYFLSWCLDEALTRRASNVVVPTSDMTLYAEWGAEEKFLLSFETGEGSDVEPVLYKYNAYLAEPEAPTREGYAFGGWYRDAEFSREFHFYGYTMPKHDVTVYAKWNEVFSIHFDSMGGSAVESLVGEAGEAVRAPEAPVREGFVFDGWYTDDSYKTAYTFTTIPEDSVTVYAKWHEQATEITVTLHLNNADAKDGTIVITCDEGEAPNDKEAIEDFMDMIAIDLEDNLLDKTLDLKANPVYTFNGWAYDAAGLQRFDGVLPQAENGALDLYATWTRSAKYCQVKFLTTEVNTEEVYYVVKNTVMDGSVLEKIEAPLNTLYKAQGCEVDGFYTEAGLRYVSGQKVVMDMELSPYLYSLDLVYEYTTLTNASGTQVNGYVVAGYKEDSTVVSKDAESLLLNIPEYYDDGENGNAAVLWIGSGAFKDYPITQANLPKRLFGLGSEAFRNTKIESVTLPSTVFELDDYVFADCANLTEVTLKSASVAWVGAKIFEGTLYEAQLPRDEKGFVYFNENETIVYGYEGVATTVETPAQSNVIAGGAFKGNTTLTKITVADGVNLICDSAFEGSAIEEIVFGKGFRSMGSNLLKDCAKLTKVRFDAAQNLAYIGTGMFRGCTALKELDLSEMYYIQLINPNAFQDCTSLEKVSLSYGFLNGYEMVSYFQAIGDYAFAGCTALKSINLPSSTTLISAHAFEGSGIESIGLSAAITKIGEYAFADCDSLEQVNLRALTLTELAEGLFKGCDNLRSVLLSDTVEQVGVSVFEDCSKLSYVNFGVSTSSKLQTIGDRAFANCTSLKKIVLQASLLSDKTVVFGKDVFLNAGYTQDGEFKTPVVYVRAGSPDYSATSQWKNGSVMYSYVEIYEKTFEGTEYAGLTVKPIDQTAPTLTVSQAVLYLTSADELKDFDILAYMQSLDLYTITDNDSSIENCEVKISTVNYIAGGDEKELQASEEGKYDISAIGTYSVMLSVEDEFGNVTTVNVQIVVSVPLEDVE